MKVLGIITEYNPLHNGHQIHLKKSLAKSNADATICIMSGSFLQRGTPAIVNQWARTKMALKLGIDLVIQLPISYSIRSAEHFAAGSIKLLDASNLVDSICFGSEAGTIEPLQFLGNLLADEPPQLSQLIQQYLTTGISYPGARAKAIIDYLKHQETDLNFSHQELATILNSSNNILGLEYIKALSNLNSSITPLTIKRSGANYNSNQLQKISSATAIRNQIKSNQQQSSTLIAQQLKQTMPQATIEILQTEFAADRGPIFPTDFGSQLLTILRRISTTDLQQYEDINGGLENRIKSAAQKTTSWSDLIDKIKTKRFTRTRIQRILAHVLLDLKKTDLESFDQAGGPLYFRILGFNQPGKELLHQIKTRGDLPLISKVANHFKSDYQPQNLLQKMLSYDLQANNIYNLATKSKENKRGNIDYRQQPILDL
jgi:predicted nucleotidyltransferase